LNFVIYSRSGPQFQIGNIMEHENIIIPKHTAFISDTFINYNFGDDSIANNQFHDVLSCLPRITSNCLELGTDIITAYLIPTKFWHKTENTNEYLDLFFPDDWTILVHELSKMGVQIRKIGSNKDLPQFLITAIDKAQSLTKDNSELILNLAFNYGSRDEITQSVKQILEDAIPEESVTKDTLNRYLFPTDIPSPELVILTYRMNRQDIHFPLWGEEKAIYYSVKCKWVNLGYDELVDSFNYYTRAKYNEIAKNN
jgi:undecaprenyl diphosphate synthase